MLSRKNILLPPASSRATNSDPFARELSEDPFKNTAFQVAVSASVVMLGKGCEKNVSKAIDSVRTQRGDRAGAFQRALQALHALHGDGSNPLAIAQTVKPLWNHGLDVISPNSKAVVYDQGISDALEQEGIILDYCIPASLRPVLRQMGKSLAEAMKSSGPFCEGLQCLKEGKPEAFNQASAWEQKVKIFDRDLLIAIQMTHHTITKIAFEALSAVLKDSPSAVGPTGWTIGCLYTQVLSDMLLHMRSGRPLAILGCASQRLSEFRFLEYYSSDASVREAMLDLKSLPKSLEKVAAAFTNYAALFQHHSMVQYLSTPPVVDELARSYLCAPPAQPVEYQTSFTTPAGEIEVAAFLSHSLLSVKLSASSAKERVCRWTLDRQGTIRTWGRQELLPVDAEDLGMTDESFEQLATDIESRSLWVLKELSDIWDEHPALYGASFPSTKAVIIRRLADGVKITVNEADLPELLRVLGIDSSTDHPPEPGAIADGRGGVQQGASVTIREVLPTAIRTEALPAHPSKVGTPISNRFVSAYCPRYDDLVRELRKFDVLVQQGHGSHELLKRDGFHYTTSKNQRDGTLLLNRHAIRGILQALNIDESNFVARVSRLRAAENAR